MTHKTTSTTGKTGLLVSVRNVTEAACALNGGADVIDVKEPNHGALGAASIGTITAIVESVGGRVPVSAACGELTDPNTFACEDLPPISFAKLGLAGCDSISDWRTRFSETWQRLPETIGRVAVAYGDWKNCGAPPPEEVILAGVENECSYVLLDTNCKTQCLFDYCTEKQLDEWSKLTKTHNMRLVVAGSIRKEQFPLIVDRWTPEYVAVRGAACTGGRNSSVSESLVSELKEQLNDVERTHKEISTN